MAERPSSAARVKGRRRWCRSQFVSDLVGDRAPPDRLAGGDGGEGK